MRSSPMWTWWSFTMMIRCRCSVAAACTAALCSRLEARPENRPQTQALYATNLDIAQALLQQWVDAHSEAKPPRCNRPLPTSLGPPPAGGRAIASPRSQGEVRGGGRLPQDRTESFAPVRRYAIMMPPRCATHARLWLVSLKPLSFRKQIDETTKTTDLGTRIISLPITELAR
jgi:hypothetical protein